VVPQWLEVGFTSLETESGDRFCHGVPCTQTNPGSRVKVLFSVSAQLDPGAEKRDPDLIPTCNVLYRTEVFQGKSVVLMSAPNLRQFGGGVSRWDVRGCRSGHWRTKGKPVTRTLFVPETGWFYHEVRARGRLRPMGWPSRCVFMMVFRKLLRRHAGLRPKLMLVGPFLAWPDNLLFLRGIGREIAAGRSAQPVVAGLRDCPFWGKCCASPAHNLSLGRPTQVSCASGCCSPFGKAFYLRGALSTAASVRDGLGVMNWVEKKRQGSTRRSHGFIGWQISLVLSDAIIWMTALRSSGPVAVTASKTRPCMPVEPRSAGGK